MPLWDFRRESTQGSAGANTQAAVSKGYQASSVKGGAGELAAKRNVIITSAGWVRRENYTDTHNRARVKEVVIVAANPGVKNIDYSSNTHTGNPDIVQMYVKLNANGFMSANATNANLYVVFNAPVSLRASGNLVYMKLANTIGGNHAVAFFGNTAAQGRIVHANNTLVFRLPKLQGGAGSVAATYHANSQSILVANTLGGTTAPGGGAVLGNPLYNPDDGITKSANLVLTGATANNLLNGIGNRIVNFKVRRNG